MLYKVKNVSEPPIHFRQAWNLNLFNDEQLAAYREWQQTDEYIGRDADEKEAFSRLNESDRVREWTTSQQLGTPIMSKNPRTKVRELEYVWEIKPREELVLNERQMNAVYHMRTRQIKQTLQLGQSAPTYHMEGILEITPLNENGSEADDNLDTLKMGELKNMAGQLGITVEFGATKQDLIQVIRAKLSENVDG